MKVRLPQNIMEKNPPSPDVLLPSCRRRCERFAALVDPGTIDFDCNQSLQTASNLARWLKLRQAAATLRTTKPAFFAFLAGL